MDEEGQNILQIHLNNAYNALVTLQSLLKHNKIMDIIEAWNLTDATLRTILKPSSIN